MPHFPLRAVCIAAGLAPFVVTHPAVRRALPVLVRAAPLVLPWLRELKKDAVSVLGPRAASVLGLHNSDALAEKASEKVDTVDAPRPVPLSMVIRRAMDDDRLTDACWNSEMREVYLWENERYWGAYCLLPAALRV